jgi:hypothetical protein
VGLARSKRADPLCFDIDNVVRSNLACHSAYLHYFPPALRNRFMRPRLLKEQEKESFSTSGAIEAAQGIWRAQTCHGVDGSELASTFLTSQGLGWCSHVFRL